ncbi:hypothetical protein [Chitinimonas taiwanensis]|uniref:hypothetical protein n=1 Tax=Chitinimonas taiwanensis TaxID=240412 RepID=UPI001114ECF6|nr:hypothetical protein [Chitinimonas taiwanensis]
MKTLLLVLIFSIAIFGGSLLLKNERPSEDSTTVHASALQALGYANSIKGTIARACDKKPESTDPRLCKNVFITPDAEIEAALVPHFKAIIPESTARDVVRLYSTPLGKSIKSKLFQVVRKDDPSLFSPEEIEELDKINHSDATRELDKFSRDKSLSQIAVNSVRFYRQ